MSQLRHRDDKDPLDALRMALTRLHGTGCRLGKLPGNPGATSASGGASHASLLLALARVPDSLGRRLLRWKWLGEGVDPRILSHSVAQLLSVTPGSDTGSRGGPGRWQRLGQLAIAVWLPRSPCPWCRGQGWIAAAGAPLMPCPHCEGSGIGQLPSGRECSRHLGVHESQWRRRWRQRFVALLLTLQHSERQALEQLRRLYGGDE
ncbi:MAG: hypothetical protein H7831_04435 [Magnetococcus sp. WYHC-3]